MSKKRRTVQPEDIIKMNELYLTIGTYAGVGRETGWSGSTVKRYINPDYVSRKNLESVAKLKFNIPPMGELVFPKNWNSFLELTKEELKSCKELQKTISF